MIREKSKEIIAKYLSLSPDKLADESQNLSDLVSESFLLIEILIELQDKLSMKLNQEDLADVRTLGNLLDVIEEKT